MLNQARVLQFIPIIPSASVDASPSIWRRVRVVVTSAVDKARSAVARGVSTAAKVVNVARATVARAARFLLVRRPWVLTRDGAEHAASRARSWCSDTWRRVVRPFMRVRVVALGIGAVVVGLAVSPVTTLVALASCGAVLVGLSRLIAALEESEHAGARPVLKCIEAGAWVLLAAAYAMTAGIIAALCLVSVAFAVTEVLELALRYFDVENAAAAAALAFFVLTANWGLAFVEIAWLAFARTDERRARAPSQERQAIPLIRIDAERAWSGDSTVDAVLVDETPRVARTSACMGCDLDDNGVRFGIGKLPSLCDQCFSFLVEDELVNAAEDGQVSAEDVTCALDAGIEVPASVIIASGARLRSTRVDLDVEFITCRLDARSDSERDPSKIYWAETAWWFDGRGNRRARQWHGFVTGLVAAKVDYEHDRGARGFYVRLPREMGPYRALSSAQEAAADEVSDARAIVSGAAATGASNSSARATS